MLDVICCPYVFAILTENAKCCTAYNQPSVLHHYFPLFPGSNVGLWWRLVEVIRDGKFLLLLTYHDFFLYSNITIFSLTRNTSTCIHTMYMFVLWWKVRWCIEAHQCFTAVLHNIYMYIEVTICRLYMYTRSNIIIIDTDLKQLSY